MKLVMRSSSGLLVLAIGVAACEIPQAPSWDVGLLVPFTRQTLEIIDFLPEGISAAEVSGVPAFIIDVAADTTEYSLGAMCEECAQLEGTSGPVPSFDYSDTLRLRFPAGLLAIDAASVLLGYRLTNGLDFDPLRPHEDPDIAGFLRIRMIDLGTGEVIDSLSLNGATETFSSGTSRDFVLEVRNTTVREGILLEVTIHSPEDGQTVSMDTAVSASARPLMDTLAVAGVTIELQDQNLEETFRIDFDEQVRRDVRDDIRSAVLELELAHNLQIEGAMDLSMAGSEADLFGGPGREVRLQTIDFSYVPEGRVLREDLSTDEIRFLTDLPQVFIGYRASASARQLDELGRPAVTFTPSDSVSARLRMTGVLGVNP